jgi:AraC-like DNA-binding protein
MPWSPRQSQIAGTAFTASYCGKISRETRHYMLSLNAQPTKLTELSWLMDVAETSQPVTEMSPIWVRHGTISHGPLTSHPEQHPYCELGTTLAGTMVAMVEGEEAERLPGDIFLVGPGVPHWAKIKQYPLKYISVCFLPRLLIDWGPQSDGAKILRRFTLSHTLNQRLVRPPEDLRQRLAGFFEAMVREFQQNQFGREIRLRTLLMEQFVVILRWEQASGSLVRESEGVEWRPIHKTLQYLREHYAEPIYAEAVARAAGVSMSRLKILFHQALGISWVKYLQGYRVRRAAALLSQPGVSVTEAAYSVGFESISHFNATFRSCMNVCPTLYQTHRAMNPTEDFHREMLVRRCPRAMPPSALVVA